VVLKRGNNLVSILENIHPIQRYSNAFFPKEFLLQSFSIQGCSRKIKLSSVERNKHETGSDCTSAQNEKQSAHEVPTFKERDPAASEVEMKQVIRTLWHCESIPTFQGNVLRPSSVSPLFQARKQAEQSPP
jgi:hypothetical protein